jgi:hypothetical protein
MLAVPPPAALPAAGPLPPAAPRFLVVPAFLIVRRMMKREEGERLRFVSLK